MAAGQPFKIEHLLIDLTDGRVLWRLARATVPSLRPVGPPTPRASSTASMPCCSRPPYGCNKCWAAKCPRESRPASCSGTAASCAPNCRRLSPPCSRCPCVSLEKGSSALWQAYITQLPQHLCIFPTAERQPAPPHPVQGPRGGCGASGAPGQGASPPPAAAAWRQQAQGRRHQRLCAVAGGEPPVQLSWLAGVPAPSSGH